MKKILSALALFVLALAQTVAQPNPLAYMDFELINPHIPITNYTAISEDNSIIGGDNGVVITAFDKAHPNVQVFSIPVKEKIIGFAGGLAITEKGKSAKYYDNKEVTQIGMPNIEYHKVAYNAKSDEYWVVGDNNAFIRGKNDKWTTGTIPVNSVNDITAVTFVNGVGYFGTDEGMLFLFADEKRSDIPTGTTNSINSIFSASNDILFFACDKGVLLKMNIHTRKFTTHTLPELADINDVRFIDNNNGLLACDGGILYATKDGGANWTKLQSKQPFTNDLNAIGIQNEQFFVVGDNGLYITISKPNNEITLHKTSFTDKDINDGVFKKRDTETEKYSFLAVADDNQIIPVLHDPGIYDSYWSANKSISLLPPDEDLISIAVNNDDTPLILTENDRLFLAQDVNLTSWKEISLNNSKDLNKIRFIKSGDQNIGFIIGDNGTVLRSLDNGATWSKVQTPKTNDLNDIMEISSYLIIVGDDGCILRSEDKGATWADFSQTVKSLLQTNINIDTLDFNYINKKQVFQRFIVACSDGYVLTYEFGGYGTAKLEKLPTISDVKSIFTSMNDFRYAFCENGEIFYSKNYNDTWKPQGMSLTAATNSILYYEDKDHCYAYCLGDKGQIIYHAERSASAEDYTAKPEVKLFPNPANDYINIELTDIDKIELYDINNSFISNIGTESDDNYSTININHIPAGAYLLKVFSPRGIDYIKFIKN